MERTRDGGRRVLVAWMIGISTVIGLAVVLTACQPTTPFVTGNTPGQQQYDCTHPVTVTLSVNGASPDPFILCTGQQISWSAGDDTDFTVSFGSATPFQDANGNHTGTFNKKSPGGTANSFGVSGLLTPYRYYKYTATVGTPPTPLPDPHGIIMK